MNGVPKFLYHACTKTRRRRIQLALSLRAVRLRPWALRLRGTLLVRATWARRSLHRQASTNTRAERKPSRSRNTAEAGSSSDGIP